MTRSNKGMLGSLFAAVVLTGLAGCGGGGGGEAAPAPTAAPAPAPAPAVATSVTASPTVGSLARGSTVQLTATVRDASGNDMSGQVLTWSSSDSSRATVSSNGVVTGVGHGAVTITVAAGSLTASSNLTMFAPPLANINKTSSYALAQASATSQPLNWRAPPAPAHGSFMLIARGLADLDGDGIVDAVLAPSLFLEAVASTPMLMLKGLGNGAFADNTANWLGAAAPKLNHPRKLLLADFNADGRPDIFVCAHGYDAEPFPGTTNTLLLSGNGKWTPADQPWTAVAGFHHGCAAADVDNDGDVDIFVTESKIGSFFLINDGSGTFTMSRTGVPASRNKASPIFVAEMIDIDGDGYIDLVTGGDEFYGGGTSIHWGDGTGSFVDARRTVLPVVTGWPNVVDIAAEDINGDGVRELVVFRTPGQYTDANFYKGYLVQVLTLKDRVATDVSASAVAATNTSARTVIVDGQGSPEWVEWTWLADHDGDGRIDMIGSDVRFNVTARFLARNLGNGVFDAWVRLP